MNSIQVTWEVSQNTGEESITFEQMNTTREKFCKLSRSEQEDLIQEALNELPERVFIAVDSFVLEVKGVNC